MRKFFNSLAIFLLLIGFSGCFGEDEKVKAQKKTIYLLKMTAWRISKLMFRTGLRKKYWFLSEKQ